MAPSNEVELLAPCTGCVNSFVGKNKFALSRPIETEVANDDTLKIKISNGQVGVFRSVDHRQASLAKKSEKTTVVDAYKVVIKGAHNLVMLWPSMVLFFLSYVLYRVTSGDCLFISKVRKNKSDFQLSFAFVHPIFMCTCA